MILPPVRHSLRQSAVSSVTVTTVRAQAPPWIKNRRPSRSRPLDDHHRRGRERPGPGDPRWDHDVDFIPLDPPYDVQSLGSTTTPPRHTMLHIANTTPLSPSVFCTFTFPHASSVSHARPWPVLRTDANTVNNITMFITLSCIGGGTDG